MFADATSRAGTWLVDAAQRSSEIAVSVASLLSDHPGTFVQLGIGGAVLWSLICRLNQMQAGVTRGLVIVQHGVLFVAVLSHMLFPIGPVALLGGIMVFLWLGAPRWRHSAPEGTRAERALRWPNVETDP